MLPANWFPVVCARNPDAKWCSPGPRYVMNTELTPVRSSVTVASAGTGWGPFGGDTVTAVGGPTFTLLISGGVVSGVLVTWTLTWNPAASSCAVVYSLKA